MQKYSLVAALFFALLPMAQSAVVDHGSKSEPASKPIVAAETKEASGASAAASNGAEPTARTWQPVFSEAGRRVEIDASSIKKGSDNKVQAYSRILFDKPLPDAVSSGTYQILEALNTYDCDKRTFATSRRVFRKDEKTPLREETVPAKAELPVRSGTLDEKLLRAACKPGNEKAAFNETVNKAKSAADTHLPAPRKEIMRTNLGTAKPGAHDAPAHGEAAAKTTPPRSAKVTKKAAPTKESWDHVHWAYEGRGGPENWGKLDPANALCDAGKRQSPIDIRDGIKVDLDPINFAYRPSMFRIIDNGHTIQANVSDNRITVLGKEYELVQLHFHRPSEERIGGRGFDMVAHLVHKSYDGQLAVVAVMIERGRENPVVQTLWNYIPLERNQELTPPSAVIDLNQLLPEKRGHFTYMGSLTTPPCSEGVLWLVMQTPVQISPEQLAIFSRLYPNNARPVQPRHDRLIKESR